jgi:hypothetical protein
MKIKETLGIIFVILVPVLVIGLMIVYGGPAH